MTYLIYSSYDMDPSFLTNSFNWLTENVGEFLERVECDRRMDLDANIPIVEAALLSVVSDFELFRIETISHNHGVGWQTFFCWPLFTLVGERQFFIVDIDDDLVALQFKLAVA